MGSARPDRPTRSGREGQRQQTRRRIVEAAVELHSTIGPARTSFSAVARQAGVTRPTLYAYFPDRESLFAACTGHVMENDPPPSVDGWSAESNPLERLRQVLIAQYAYYRRHAQRIANLERDMSAPGAGVPRAPTIEQARRQAARRLAEGLMRGARRADLVESAVSHALEFSTWRTLTGNGTLADVDAVELMIALVNYARATPERALA